MRSTEFCRLHGWTSIDGPTNTSIDYLLILMIDVNIVCRSTSTTDLWFSLTFYFHFFSLDSESRTKRCHDIVGSSSAQSKPIPTQDPWPKEGEKYHIHTFEAYADPYTAVRSRECTHHQIMEVWDDYDSLFYNTWQDVTIKPTRSSTGIS